MEVATPSLNPASTSGSNEAREWEFLQCFGERSPGEDIQEGVFLEKSDSFSQLAV